ncbi:hypothetical protein [Microvirga sesbaniae]|uniref:hypothetical protein n=1 Tax=Microvirga sesbaniae TaxID=681392 RepID=UPI0021C7B1CF|nr:hypothetical protein [Microvirga sp. HBU67692]
MASIRDYNTTADSNTDIAPEGMAPSAVNNAIRAVQGELAKYLKDDGGSLSAGGSSNAYTITLSTAPTSLVDGLNFSFTANHTNTGAATLVTTPAGGGAFASKSIRRFVNNAEVALAPGDIVSGGRYSVQYEAAANGGSGAYILLNPSGTGSTLFGAEGGTEPAVTAGGIGSAAAGLQVSFTATAPNLVLNAGCHYEKTSGASETEVYSFIRLIATTGGTTVAQSQVQYSRLDTRVARGIGNANMGLVVTGLSVGTQYTVRLYFYQSNGSTAVAPRGQWVTGQNIG